jgi:hypothetical protein
MPWRPHDAKRLAREAREARAARERAAGLAGGAPAFTPPQPTRQHVIKGAHGDPLAIFREGLALARRAGMPWEQALTPTRSVALSVESDKREREQWTAALDATLAAWRWAYERKPTSCAL